jgi:hypothetical protein
MRHEQSPKDAAESFRTLDGAHCYFGLGLVSGLCVCAATWIRFGRRGTLSPEVPQLLDYERYVCLAREEIGRAARDS